MNASMQTIHPLMRPGGLGASLIQHGLTDEVSIETAINDAQTNGRSIITQLIGDGIVTSRQLAEIASTEYGLPLYNLKSYDSSHIPDDILSEQFILDEQYSPPLETWQTIIRCRL